MKTAICGTTECFEHCCVSLCEFSRVLSLHTFLVVMSSFLNKSHIKAKQFIESINCFANHERDKNLTSQNRKWSPVDKRESGKRCIPNGIYRPPKGT